MLGCRGEGTILQADVGPNERCAVGVSVPNRIQDILLTEFSRPSCEGMLEIDSRGRHRFFPRAKVLASCFVELAIAPHVVHGSQIVTRDAERAYRLKNAVAGVFFALPHMAHIHTRIR